MSLLFAVTVSFHFPFSRLPLHLQFNILRENCYHLFKNDSCCPCSRQRCWIGIPISNSIHPASCEQVLNYLLPPNWICNTIQRLLTSLTGYQPTPVPTSYVLVSWMTEWPLSEIWNQRELIFEWETKKVKKDRMSVDLFSALKASCSPSPNGNPSQKNNNNTYRMIK